MSQPALYASLALSLLRASAAAWSAQIVTALPATVKPAILALGFILVITTAKVSIILLNAIVHENQCIEKRPISHKL